MQSSQRTVLEIEKGNWQAVKLVQATPDRHTLGFCLYDSNRCTKHHNFISKPKLSKMRVQIETLLMLRQDNFIV